jgi:hypothetical protein
MDCIVGKKQSCMERMECIEEKKVSIAEKEGIGEMKECNGEMMVDMEETAMSDGCCRPT